jgi:hypothetical protein
MSQQKQKKKQTPSKLDDDTSKSKLGSLSEKKTKDQERNMDSPRTSKSSSEKNTKTIDVNKINC